MMARSLFTTGSLPSETNHSLNEASSASTTDSAVSLGASVAGRETFNMKQTYHLRRAKDQGDLEGICELENLLFDNAFGWGTIRRELEASYVVVARTDHPFVPYGVGGYAIVRPDPALADLLRLGVHPELHGTGIGQAILEDVLRRYPGPMMLMVRKNNSRALGMYRRRGFQIVGTTDSSWVMRR